ncbi:MAG: disulfide bond formation protein B [Candidatus Nanopelagicales bacterium]
MTTSTVPGTAGRWAMAPDRAVFLSRVINILALFGLILVLAGSLHLQFGVGEQPCPLCIVQRSGMIGLAVGPMMNLLWGMSPRNYALSILAAVVGAAGSTRQILLHIADPNDPGYGPEVFGWHLYTWAFVTFLVGIVGCTMLILWQAPFRAGDRGVLKDPGKMRPIVTGMVIWLSIMVSLWVTFDLIAVGASVIPECGLGPCPDDPPDTAGIADPGGWVAVMSVGLIAAVIAAVVERRWRTREKGQA